MAQGISTLYRNTTFRSRTEARWFAFFDLLGWQWEYEPFDAAGYIPDGVLIGERPVLIEIKPDVTTRDLARYTERVTNAVRGIWQHDILILGSTPFPHDNTWPDTWDTYPAIGLHGEHTDPDIDHGGEIWWFAPGRWHQCGAERCDAHAFHHELHSFTSRPCGHYDGDHYLNPPDLDALRPAWERCRDIARWTPNR